MKRKQITSGDEQDVAYQWQWSADGKKWTNCTSTGYNTDTFHFEMKEKFNGRQYRCVVSDGVSTITSNVARLTMENY